MDRVEIAAWLTLALNAWIAWQNRPPPRKPGRHRKR